MTVEATRGTEYQVFTPVKTYTGETAKIEFYRGRAVITDQYAREQGYADAEEVTRLLVNDFGYRCEPDLPAIAPAKPRQTLRERAEEVERSEGTVPFFPPEIPVGDTHATTIEPGTRTEPPPSDSPPKEGSQ